MGGFNGQDGSSVDIQNPHLQPQLPCARRRPAWLPQRVSFSLVGWGTRLSLIIRGQPFSDIPSSLLCHFCMEKSSPLGSALWATAPCGREGAPGMPAASEGMVLLRSATGSMARLQSNAWGNKGKHLS